MGETLWDVLPQERVPGGAPMNVAARLAAFGLPVHLLSRVGNDADGRQLLEHVERQGLTPRFMQIDEQFPTGTVQVDLSNPEAPRFDILHPVAWDFIDADQYIGTANGSADILVFGSLAARHDVSRKSLMQLLECASLRIFDANLRPPFTDRGIIESLLQQSHWLKLNETELEVLASWVGVVDSRADAMRALQEKYELEAVCVTLGADGSLLLHRDELMVQKAFDVCVINTIGCGDAFLGSWIAGMLTGVAPRESLRRAAAAGALVAADKGGSPIIAEDDVDALIRHGQLLG